MIQRGAHANRYGDDVVRALADCGLILGLDHGPAAQQFYRERRAAGGTVFGRHHFWGQSIDDAWTDWACGEIIRRHDPACYDAWQAPWNEFSQESREQLEAYARATVRACDRLHAAGIAVAVGAFGVGWPKVEEFDAFLTALEVGDYLLLHQYWRDNPTDASTALRHRLLWDRLPEHLRVRYQGRVIIGEMGMDWGGDGLLDGWRRHTDAAAYAGQLRQWFGEADRDGYLMGACLFSVGGGAYGWPSFEVLGEPGLYVWRHQEEVVTVPEFKFGFKDLADRLGTDVVGEPVEDEHYFPDGKISLQVTTRGMMVYSKEGNLPGFLPFFDRPEG